MKHFSFYSRTYLPHLPSLRHRWGRALLLTCLMWLMAWSLSFAQGDGARPEIIVNMPSEVENTGEPFDIEVSVRNIGNEAADFGSITLSFPEGHGISVEQASVSRPQSNECFLDGSHARVLNPESGCEALVHNTGCSERIPIQQPIAELFHRGWGAGEEQSMTVRVFPNPDRPFVTVYVRAAFRPLEDEGCNLIIAPDQSTADGVDQQSFPIESYLVELVERPTEVVPPTETAVPPTETPLPPTETPIPPTDVPTEVPVPPTEVPTVPTETVAEVLPTPTPLASASSEDNSFLGQAGLSASILMLCVIFLVLFLILCLLIWLVMRSRSSSNAPSPPSQPFNPPSQPNPPSYPSHPVGYRPPSQPNPPSYPGYSGQYTPPPGGYTPPAGEGTTRQWSDDTQQRNLRPPSTPPPSYPSQPMGATQPEFKPPSSPFVTKLVISTPPVDPTCLQCGTSQRNDASFCSTCGFPRPVVGKRYALLRRLGKGGMGAVYLAQDKRLAGKQWAVKEMLDQLSTSPEMQQKVKEAFEQEAQLLATLEHPNLPRVIDFLSEEERYYLVMDFVEGETLQDLLNMRETPFSEQEVLGWAAQLCEVLAYLHNQQPSIIFRDLKPSNIMLTPKRRIQLIDFGIARLFKPDRDQDTVFMGTPGYAAPEQFSGSAQTDARTDIYALGVVLHHLLTKHPPETTMFTMPKVRQLNPAVSPRMEAVIEQALQHDPRQRFASVQALKMALGL